MSDMGSQIRDYLDATTTVVEAREAIMGSTFTEERDGSAEDRRWGYRWLVAVAVAAAIVAAVLLLWPGGDGEVVPIDQPSDDVPIVGEGDEPLPTEPVAVVEAAIEAFEAGDLDRLAELSENEIGGWLLGPPELVAGKAEANARFVGDGSCAQGDDPTTVVCRGTETNDYWGAAGLDRTGTLIVVVVDGTITEVVFQSQDDDELVLYGERFLEWFMVSHPGVYASLPSYEGEAAGGHRIAFSTSGVPIAGAMSTALTYVDEFVAQSDLYPITP